MPPGSVNSAFSDSTFSSTSTRAVCPLLADRAGVDHRPLRLGRDVLAHQRQDLRSLGRRLVGQLLTLGKLVLKLHLGP